MKKILFLSSIFPRSYDLNRGIYCLQMLRAMAVDHEVKVVSPIGWTEAIKKNDPSLNGEKEQFETIYPIYFYLPLILRSKFHLFMWWSIRRRVIRLMQTFQPDIVLSYWAHPDGAVAVKAAKLVGARVGIIVGGSDVLILPRDPSRRRAIVAALNAADAVFTVGRDLKEKAIQLGIPGEKIFVVHKGIAKCFSSGDRNQSRRILSLPNDESILVWVGRFDPVKGLEVLLQACKIIANKSLRFRLYLVGDGQIRPKIETMMRELKLENHVFITGMVPHDALPDWYRAANLTVLSSHSEGIPNVLRESLACGTPYVSTDVGGVSELSDDPSIKLVPPNNPQAFAEAIESSLTNPSAPIAGQFQSWCEYSNNILQHFHPPYCSRSENRS